MRYLSVALSLGGCFICARLSLKDTLDTVRCPREMAGGRRACVHPEGPLNIVNAHALVNNDMIAKKRRFSAPLRISYELKEMGESTSALRSDPDGTYTYSRDPTNDSVCDFTRSDAMDYLRAYYTAMKVLFRVIGETVLVSTNHHTSFYKYVCEQLSEGERAQFFAVLFVLAGGGAITAERVPVDADGRETPTTTGIVFSCANSTLLELDLKFRKSGGGKPLYADEVLAVAEFFAKHGAADVERAYGVHYSDSPAFLIQSYIYEFADSRAFVDRVFGCVDALLPAVYPGDELAAARARFFTADEQLVGDYSREYEVLTKIEAISLHTRFPFSRSNTPLEHQVVYRYDEAAGRACTAVSYSDCAEIALYNTFCCLLFDPKTRAYSTGHLRERGCAPTARLEHFFADVCTAPNDSTGRAGIHQEWARVAQGLVQAPGGDASPAGARRSLVTYVRNSKRRAAVELETDLGNLLMALATIAGLPTETTEELQRLVAGCIAGPNDGRVAAELSNAIAEALGSVSVMPVKVELEVRSSTAEKLYGALKLSFQPQPDDGADAGELHHVVVVESTTGHVKFFHTPHAIKLGAAERAFFAAHEGADANAAGESRLRGLICESARRFLGVAASAAPPSAHIAEVAAADSPMALYAALTRWMAHAAMRTQDDLLAAIDQLFPTFTGLLGQSSGSSSAPVQPFDEQSGSSLAASSPLVLLIANILGSMPLCDYATRALFFNTALRCCVAERPRLFPAIAIPPSVYSLEADQLAGFVSRIHFRHLSDNRLFNIALYYLRKLAPAHSAEADDLFKRFLAPYRHTWRVLPQFMAHGVTEGVELLRARCMPDSSDASEGGRLRRVQWLYAAAQNRRYGDVRAICDSWDGAPLTFSLGELASYYCDSPSQPPAPLSRWVAAEVYPEGPAPAQLGTLLGLYTLFVSSAADYAGVLGVFESSLGVLDAAFVAAFCGTVVDRYHQYCARNPLQAYEHRGVHGILKAFVDTMKWLRRNGKVSISEDIFEHCERQLEDCDRRLTNSLRFMR
ncbi:hypothetical protein PAPHI01_0681 [Pancytospora philotis]|nr:hypothetical protein PAPHI01_0681 [Pancytospora philotis]